VAFKSFRDLFGSKKRRMQVTEEYQKWREMIFSMQPSQVGEAKGGANTVYGVIMDIGQMDRQSSTPWAITLTAFSTGEASFRPTPGGGMMGLGGDPKVAQAAQEIVQIAQGLVPEANLTQDLSLPEPGIVQFFFLTTSGVYVVKGNLDQFQKPEHPFRQLLERFHFIRQSGDQLLDGNRTGKIKALYVVALTPRKMERNELVPVVFMAVDRLKAKDPTFNQRMQEMAPKAPIEINNTEFIPATHTPTNMQTLMSEWVKRQYNVTFNPTPESNFFLHGVRSPEGKQHIFLFYFDIES
jgi:hypothetical protein